MTGAITGYIDIAQLTLYAFWIFFAGLIFYLRREDKREGYPLLSDRSPNVTVQGFPPLPTPKYFLRASGEVIAVPRPETAAVIQARPAEPWPGAPLVPTGNPLVDAVGPAAYANRADKPENVGLTQEPLLVPLRADPEWFLTTEDPDPRGMTVYGADRLVAGMVTDVWIDRSEAIIRYVEVSIETARGTRSVLAPMTMLKIDRVRRRINVFAITAAQFVDVPATRNPNQVTLLEEDKIMAYFGGGTLYALPSRAEPLL